MATALPSAASLTGASTDNATQKSNFTALRAYLAGLLGTTGNVSEALTTLGVLGNAALTKSGAYTIAADDRGKLIQCSGTWSLGLLAAASAGDGWSIVVKNSGTGIITIDPNLSETIEGVTTLQLFAGESAMLLCTGSAWVVLFRDSGVPSGTGIDYYGGTVPSGWLLCNGAAISRTTYASLFSAIGTTYGAGDGSSTFNLPDCRGRVGVGKDNMGGSAANRVTFSGSGIDGTTLGATGGAQAVSLTTAQLPSHDHVGPVYSSSFSPLPVGNAAFSSQDAYAYASGYAGGEYTGQNAAFQIKTAYPQGDGQAHPNMQPAIICNKIIKI